MQSNVPAKSVHATNERTGTVAENETVRDVLARMADDAAWVEEAVNELGDLTQLPPTTLIEALGMSSLVVRASGMVAVACGDAVARLMSDVATATSAD